MKLATAAGLVATVLLPAFAQPPAPLTPLQPYENLAFFEGKWTVEGDDREYRETCAWLPEGRRHMICRARWKSSTGPRESMSIFSHEQGVGYVRYGMNPMGRVDRMRGRLDGERWLWSADGGAEAKTTRIRASVTPEGKSGFRFTEETSEDGGPWKQSADVRYLRLP